MSGHGGLVALFAVVLPSFFLVLACAMFYVSYGSIPAVASVFSGFLPAVLAIIVTVTLRLYQQFVVTHLARLICLGSFLSLLLLNSVYSVVITLVCCAALGALISPATPSTQPSTAASTAGSRRRLLQILLAAALFILCGWSLRFLPDAGLPQSLSTLAIQFSGLSVIMFGGGYVSIPALKALLVDELAWIAPQAFTDAIAIGQLTPGPILISATFFGFLLRGIAGSIITSLAIFVPPGLLTMVASELSQAIQHHRLVQAAFNGIRPGVVGLVGYAVISIGKDVPRGSSFELAFSLVLFVGALTLLLRRVSVPIVVLACGGLGLMAHLLTH